MGVFYQTAVLRTTALQLFDHAQQGATPGAFQNVLMVTAPATEEGMAVRFAIPRCLAATRFPRKHHDAEGKAQEEDEELGDAPGAAGMVVHDASGGRGAFAERACAQALFSVLLVGQVAPDTPVAVLAAVHAFMQRHRPAGLEVVQRDLAALIARMRALERGAGRAPHALTF